MIEVPYEPQTPQETRAWKVYAWGLQLELASVRYQLAAVTANRGLRDALREAGLPDSLVVTGIDEARHVLLLDGLDARALAGGGRDGGAALPALGAARQAPGTDGGRVPVGLRPDGGGGVEPASGVGDALDGERFPGRDGGLRGAGDDVP